jgi:glycosyltransferase involved in cell wall biosynthesis
MTEYREGLFRGKRILHLIGNSEFGGDTVYMFALAERMRDHGAQVYIGTTAPETIFVADRKRLPVMPVPSLRREIHPWHDCRSLMHLIYLCRKHRFHAVHTHTSKPGAIGRIAARLAGTPCVVHTIQGFAFHSYSGRLERVIYKNIERLAGQFCDLAISVNNEDRLTAVNNKIIAPHKIVTIFNGVDSARFDKPFDRRSFRRSLGLRDDEKLVGNVGRMWTQKDPRTFIEAAKLLAGARKDVRCLFLGDGPMMAEMKRFADSLGLGDRLLLPGFQRNVEDYLRAFDIYVLNSLWEGLPVALVEAMCVGLPIVVTDIKGNRECVDDSCALIVKPQDPGEISAGVIRLMDDPAYAKLLGTRARERFLARFTEEQMMEATFAEYEKLFRTKLRSSQLLSSPNGENGRLILAHRPGREAAPV